MTMKSADELHKAGLAYLEVLRDYRSSEQTKVLVQMLDAMVGEYQARLLDCPESEIQPLRSAGQQLKKLRIALTADDLNRVSLTV